MAVFKSIGYIAPSYRFESPDQDTVLDRGIVSITVDGEKYFGGGSIVLELTPKPAIIFNCQFHNIFQGKIIRILFEPKVTCFEYNGKKIEGFASGLSGEVGEGKWLLRWHPSYEGINIRGDHKTSLNRLVFHLFNFVNFIGSRVDDIVVGNGELQKIPYELIRSGKWAIKIQSQPNSKDTFKYLNERGGYALTHMGCIERTDGANFTGEDASRLLAPLGCLFSFAKGAWCQPICAVGYGAGGNRVWEQLNSPKAPWGKPMSWFAQIYAEPFASLFSGFFEKWKDDN